MKSSGGNDHRRLLQQKSQNFLFFGSSLPKEKGAPTSCTDEMTGNDPAKFLIACIFFAFDGPLLVEPILISIPAQDFGLDSCKSTT